MKIIVIGAGIGGLAAAARLQSQGHQVTIVEKQGLPGGRANMIKQAGFTFDTGPTLLMMTDVLIDTFLVCGRDIKDYLDLVRIEPNYRVTLADHSKVTMSSHLPTLKMELAKIDPLAPIQVQALLDRLEFMYHEARGKFIDRNFDQLFDFISPTSAIKLACYGGLKKLTNFMAGFFDDPRLVQLFSFQAMYLGVSPYDAPAIYAILPYIEIALGIWYPKGGMYQLPTALARLVDDLGGIIRYRSPVKRIIIKSQQATGVELASGEVLEAEIVISNADLTYTYTQLLQANERPHLSNKAINRYRHSSSVLMFHWGVDDDLEGLLHHNIYLSGDFKANLDDIFKRGRVSNDSSFYLHVPSKTDPKQAPPGQHALSVLIPVPNLSSNIDWKAAQSQLQDHILAVLKSHYQLDISHKIITESVATPQDFANDYNLVHGAAFGLSHYFHQSGYFRPHNYVKGIRGLYLVGASTYPGSGVPMVLLGGKLVSERIFKDYSKK